MDEKLGFSKAHKLSGNNNLIFLGVSSVSLDNIKSFRVYKKIT